MLSLFFRLGFAFLSRAGLRPWPFYLCLLGSWDARQASLCPAYWSRWGLANFCSQLKHWSSRSLPSEQLGLQAWATTPSPHRECLRNSFPSRKTEGKEGKISSSSKGLLGSKAVSRKTCFCTPDPPRKSNCTVYSRLWVNFACDCPHFPSILLSFLYYLSNSVYLPPPWLFFLLFFHREFSRVRAIWKSF
jgi:hypothetical protein